MTNGSKSSILLAVSFLFFLSGCGERNFQSQNINFKQNNPSSPSITNPNDENSQPPATAPEDSFPHEEDQNTSFKFLACYPGGPQEVCFPTLNLDQIQDQNQGYNYKNPYSNNSFPSAFDPNNYRAPQRLLSVDDRYSSYPLADHFRFGEFLANRKGPFGLVSKIALNHLEQIRQQLGKAIHPTSGYRSPRHNDKIGGATWSRHMYGDAFDFYSPQASLSELKSLCQRNGASFIQVYKTHVHCDWRDEQKDSNFYDNTELPRPAMDMAHQRYLQLSQELDIEQEISTSSERNIQLSAHVPYQEDPEPLLIEWQVKQQGTTQIFYGKNIELPKGKYQIQLNVGSTLTKKFIIK